jgi:hypothetical protein
MTVAGALHRWRLRLIEPDNLRRVGTRCGPRPGVGTDCGSPVSGAPGELPARCPARRRTGFRTAGGSPQLPALAGTPGASRKQMLRR